jgi:hypothetical protein
MFFSDTGSTGHIDMDGPFSAGTQFHSASRIIWFILASLKFPHNALTLHLGK